MRNDNDKLRAAAERIAAERQKAREAEGKEKKDFVAQLNAGIKKRKEAEAAQKKAAREEAQQKLKKDQEAEIRRNVRMANSTLSAEDFDRLYPRLRDAWLIEEAAAAAERTKRYFRDRW